jgi:hypothetical protein
VVGLRVKGVPEDVKLNPSGVVTPAGPTGPRGAHGYPLSKLYEMMTARDEDVARTSATEAVNTPNPCFLLIFLLEKLSIEGTLGWDPVRPPPL